MRGKELDESYIFSSTKDLSVVKLRERNREFILFSLFKQCSGKYMKILNRQFQMFLYSPIHVEVGVYIFIYIYIYVAFKFQSVTRNAAGF
jgi:hypothetical protein